ncbi:MAG: hypothetical protein KC414_15010 [Romboutsia sp.]|nr:hypothetical protein [Romboutsia sp.]
MDFTLYKNEYKPIKKSEIECLYSKYEIRNLDLDNEDTVQFIELKPQFIKDDYFFTIESSLADEGIAGTYNYLVSLDDYNYEDEFYIMLNDISHRFKLNIIDCALGEIYGPGKLPY